MPEAILYTSNSGFTKQYAELLSGMTGLPAYNMANSIPPALRGKPVVYMGWLMAGGIQGYPKAAKKYDVRAVCAVGMAPSDMDQTAELKKRYRLAETPLFYMQGGFDMKRMRGLYKIMMGVMSKKILNDLPKEEERTQAQQDMYRMCTEGANMVSAAQLDGIAAWCGANP